MSKKNHQKSSKFVIEQHKYLQKWINKNIENPIPHFDYKVNHVHTTNPETAKTSVDRFGFDHQDLRGVAGAMIDLLAERVLLYAQMNEIEMAMTPSERFNKMSETGLGDDETLAVVSRQLQEVTQHHQLIELFKQWYNYDTDPDIIELLPTQIWALWTQIQGNYATW